MDGPKNGTSAAIRKKCGEGANYNHDDAPARVLEPLNGDSVKTFWRFRREATAGGEAFRPETFSNSTSTTAVLDWGILHEEVRPIIVIARNQELSLKAIKKMAPNLAHWSTDRDILDLLDMCSSSGQADEMESTNLDSLGRRKRVPTKGFIDDLVARRLGLSIGTIPKYRRRRALSRNKP